MTNVKTYMLCGLSIGTLLFNSLQGFFWENQTVRIELDNGYRWDRIDEANEVVDSLNILPYTSGEKQFKDLSIYQLGGRACWESCNLLIKGTGHYGWAFDGTFNDNGFQKGKLKGYTIDASAGIGYVIPVNCCFEVVPLIGFGYDRQHFDVKHIRTHISDFPVVTDRAHFTATWYAPWVGVDLLYDSTFYAWNMCHHLSFTSGYEFHYGVSRIKWKEDFFNFAGGGDFSYNAKMKNMMGHVFHFDTRYHLPNDWLVGLELEYTFWSNAHKDRDHFGGSVDSGLAPTQEQRTFKLKWQSISTILTLGKAF